MWAFFVIGPVVVSPRYLVRGLRCRPARIPHNQEGSVVGSFEGGEPTHNIKHHPLSQEESSNVDE
jgi:hypothetical protein